MNPIGAVFYIIRQVMSYVEVGVSGKEEIAHTRHYGQPTVSICRIPSGFPGRKMCRRVRKKQNWSFLKHSLFCDIIY
jgi:hypothetical protein